MPVYYLLTRFLDTCSPRFALGTVSSSSINFSAVGPEDIMLIIRVEIPSECDTDDVSDNKCNLIQASLKFDNKDIDHRQIEIMQRL